MSAVRGQVRVGKTFNPAHKDRLFFRINWQTGEITCVHGIVVDKIPSPSRQDWKDWHEEEWDAHAYDEHCRFH